MKVCLFQIYERIRKFERKRLSKFASIDDQTFFVGYTAKSESHVDDRAWPSGKAPVFGTGIRGFESLRPSQSKTITVLVVVLLFLGGI